MNIALVHDWLTSVAGAERVLLVLAEIFPQAPIYTSVFDKTRAKPFSKLDIKTSIFQSWPFLKSRRELLVPLTPYAFENFDLSKYDLVISNTTFSAKGVLTKPNTIHISYCHTPTRYLWEPEIDPRSTQGFLSGLRKKTARRLRVWDKAASARPDYYFANSEYIKNRIKKHYGRDSSVIYPPVDIEKFSPAKPKEIKKYFLFVSRLVSYKKGDIVIETFNRLGLPLKVIGRGPERARLQKIAKPNIEFLGHLSDSELRRYYKEARAFIFAAEEDFGIVPVEAMAAGRPVIAYGKGGAVETVIAGKTGLFFDKQSPEAIIEAVKKFNPGDYNPQIIRKQAERFSTERFKKEFRAAVEEIINIKTQKSKAQSSNDK